MQNERVMGIEPTLEAWEAAVLPLNYTRIGCPGYARPLRQVCSTFRRSLPGTGTGYG